MTKLEIKKEMEKLWNKAVENIEPDVLIENGLSIEDQQKYYDLMLKSRGE